MKLEKLGISPMQFLNASTLILIGIISYYFAPAAFIYQNIKLFLSIINMILILMMIGFVLLLNLAQFRAEKAILKLVLMCVPKDRILEDLIVKNLQAHKRRNSKTSLMYTIAVAFLIFGGTGFSLQASTVADAVSTRFGCDILVSHPLLKEGLNEYQMRLFLDDYNERFPGNLRDYSFVSLSFFRFPKTNKPVISPLSQFPWKKINVRGVERNFLNSTI